MNIESLLNSKSPEPDGALGSRSINDVAHLLHAEVRSPGLLHPQHAIQHMTSAHDHISNLPYDLPPPKATQIDSPHSLVPPPLLPSMMPQASHSSYLLPGAYQPDETQAQLQHDSSPSVPTVAAGEDALNDASLGKTFVCKNCNKGFARRSDLVRHERIHSGQRPHRCDHPGCDKQFIQRSALTVHKRVHTGEKPHICTNCAKPFSDSSSLARHRRIHSGKRPYKCEVPTCQKTFTRRTTLKRHEQQHQDKAKKLLGLGATLPVNESQQSPNRVKTESNRGSGSPETRHSSSPEQPHEQFAHPQLPAFMDSTSYPGSGPAQYASKALDMNEQSSLGSYYRPNTFPNIDLRHPAQVGLSYPPLAAPVAATASSYHAVSAPATIYHNSRRSSLHHSPPLYHSPEAHTGQIPSSMPPPQQMPHYLEHRPEMQYPSNAHEWPRPHGPQS